MKVLVTGAPGRSLPTLFRRVADANKSNGPCDLLFCIGSFFCHAGKEHASGLEPTFSYTVLAHI